MRVIGGALLASIVIYAWGMLSWMVLGVHDRSIKSLSNESEVVAALQAGKATSGAYIVPNMPSERTPGLTKEQLEAGVEAWKAKVQAGPTFVLFYTAEGVNPMDPQMMIKGWAIDFGIALIAGLLLWMVAPALPTFTLRWLFMIGLGVFLAAAANLPNWNWMGFSKDYTMAMVVDNLVAMAAGGMMLALMIRPPSQLMGPN